MKRSRVKLPIVLFLLLIGVALVSPMFRKTSEDWHFSGFTQVRAYVYNEDDRNGKRGGLILPDGTQNPTRRPVGGVLLSEGQVEKLRVALMGPKSSTISSAACFFPHHAFEFLDADGNRVGYIDICFICSEHRGKPSGFGPINFSQLGNLVRELDLEYNPE